MKYQKIIDKITSGTVERSGLAQLKKNAEAKLSRGDKDAQSVLDAINLAKPADTYVVFMGFCPNAELANRQDIAWKQQGICRFDYLESEVQLERFHSICVGDLVVLKKREQFGKTMNLYGWGRVRELALDDDNIRYLKMDWSPQEDVIEVPLMACNSTVDIRDMRDVESAMPEEFFTWLGETSPTVG